MHPLTTWALNLENIQQLHVELILYIKAKMMPLMYVTEKFEVFLFFWQQRYVTQRNCSLFFIFHEMKSSHCRCGPAPLNEGRVSEALVSVVP